MSKSKEELVDQILLLQKQIKKAQANKYLKDLFLFNRNILKIEEGKGKVKMSQAHKDMCRFIDEERDKYKLLLFPRGHMKSTVVTVGHSIRRICENPKVRILIANATYSLATSFLEQIKSHLKGNKTIHEYYGDYSKNASKWSENQIKVFEHGELVDYDAKEATVTAMGITGSLTSQHYDVIIIDDGVNRENIGTIDQIRKVYKFYQDALDLLEPGGELIVIGTRWHDVDLYGWIMEGDRDKPGEIPKSVLKEILPYQFVYKGKTFNIMKRKVVEGDTAIWPEKFTTRHINMLKREKSPYEFSSQYNNEPLSEADQTFKKEWFRYYIEDDIKNRNMFNFTMVDPAISQSESADYTVLTTIAVDEYYNWWIREIVRRRMLPNETIDEMFRINEIFRPITMGIEIVSFQKMLSYSLDEEMRRRGRVIPIKELRPPTNKSKEMRIKSLQPGYHSGKIFHKERMPNLEYLEDELLRFPKGSHDDIIDSLAYFTEFALPPKTKAKKAKKRSYLYG